MSRPSQTESVYVQTLPDGKCLCPDFRAFKIFRAFIVRSKVLMSRLSCIQNCLCPDFRAFQKKKSCAPKLIICAFMSRLSCVQKSSCPDFRAFKIAYVQTFVRSKRKFVRSKINNLCVHVQTIVRSKVLMSRLSCVQNCLCPDFLAFQKKIRALQN